MSPSADTQDTLKRLAAEHAVQSIHRGMVLGLGTGTTMVHAIDWIGRQLREGTLKDIVGVPTSERTAEQARRLGIPLGSLDDYPHLDLAIDGADEVDPDLNLVKGRGGALLREKMVDSAAREFIAIVDNTKLVDQLGSAGPVPVETVQFCWRYTAATLRRLGCDPRLRVRDDRPYVTDNGNYILDCFFQTPLKCPVDTGTRIKALPGVVEHGLFLGLATRVVVAAPDGIHLREKPR
jgi:ribose 5-phosphate isomerase A